MEAIGELVFGLVGCGVLYLLTGGRWKAGSSHIAEFIVGGLTCLLLLVAGVGAVLLFLWLANRLQ
jgi:hypothetical protein